MRFSFITVLTFATAVFAQDVVFSPKYETGIISQVYGINPGSHVIGTYVDTVRPAEGQQLTVTFHPFRRRQKDTVGTQFDFLPTESKYMGYKSTKEKVYGHLALTAEIRLHLTVTTNSPTDGGPVPYLAQAFTQDDGTQLSQFWSLETATGLLSFVGIENGVESILPTAIAPAKVVSAPELVHLVPIRDTNGRFYFTKA